MKIRIANLPPHLRGDAARCYLASRRHTIIERREPGGCKRRIKDALVLAAATVLAACALFHLIVGICGFLLHVILK